MHAWAWAAAIVVLSSATLSPTGTGQQDKLPAAAEGKATYNSDSVMITAPTSVQNTWINVSPSAAPSPRYASGMAYGSLLGIAILHGGIGPGYAGLNDTWVYSPATNAWTNVTGPVRPGTFFVYTTQTMAYDPMRDRVLLFGGCGDPCSLPNGTWSFDPNTATWTDLNPPAPGPWASHDARMVYDGKAGRFLLFGGGPLAPHFFSDGSNTTWAYDWATNTWTDRKPTRSPPARFGQGMAYDAAADRVILFGGCVQTGYEMCASANDTWAYDYANNTWTNLTPATSPSPGEASMVYDDGADRAILFGVRGNETWAFDIGANRWVNQSPMVSPGVRSMFAMVYDSVRGDTVLFGGYTPSGPANDTWTYAYGLVTPTAPSAPRALAAVGGRRQVTLMWQPPANDGGYPIAAYRIYRGTVPGGESFLVQVGNVLTYTDTGLATLSTYFYQVSAVSIAGEGPRSAEASAAPPDLTDPTVAITSPPDGATLPTADVSVRGTASDDVAVLRVEISTNYLNWTPATGTATWIANVTLPPGANRLWAMATDTSGNTALVSINITVSSSGTGSNPTTGGGPNPSGLPLLAIEVGALVSIGVVAAVAIVFLWRRDRRGGPRP